MFLLIGLAGLLLPFLPGWLFLALGSLILAPDIPFFRRLLVWIQKRFPALKKPIRKARAKLAPSPSADSKEKQE